MGYELRITTYENFTIYNTTKLNYYENQCSSPPQALLLILLDNVF